MKRREFLAISATAGAAAALPSAARAQGKVPVVGFLWRDTVAASPYVSTLLGALYPRGYVPGRNLRTETRIVVGDGPASDYAAQLADSAAFLVRSQVDVIVTYGAAATHAAAKATRDIPIAMITGADPVAAGLVKSLAQPGGNITGITTLSLGLVGNRMALLKEAVPNLTHVGSLLGATASADALRENEEAARSLGLKLTIGKVNDAQEIDTAVAALHRAGVGGVHVSGAAALAAQGRRVVAAMAKHALPAAYASERYVDAGGLMVLVPSVHKVFIRLASYVERILRGAPAATMPIEVNSDVELTLNLKAAAAARMEFSAGILARADRVIAR